MKLVRMTFELRDNPTSAYTRCATVRADRQADGKWTVSVSPPSTLESYDLNLADLDTALEQITQMRQFVERVQGILEP